MKIIKKIWNLFWKESLFTQLIFVILLGFGLYFRISNLFNLGFVWDLVTTQYEWSKNAYQMGIFNFWKNFNLFYDYPPIILFFETFLYTITRPFGGTAQQFVTLLKTVNMFFDLGLVFLIIHFGISYKAISNKLSFILAGLFFALPGVWFVSGVWGQVDSIITILMIGVLWLFANMKNNDNDISLSKDVNFLIGICFGLIFLFKQQAILLLPIIIIIYFSNLTIKKLKTSIPFVLYFLITFKFLFGAYENQSIYSMGTTVVVLIGILFTSIILGSLIQNSSRNFYRFWLGFISLIALIYTPLFFANHIRSISTLLAFLGRGKSLNREAANVWKLLNIQKISTDTMFSIGAIDIKYSHFGFLMVLLVLFLIYIFRYIDIQRLKKNLNLFELTKIKFSFGDLLIFLYLINGVFYLYMPGMHSRYMHIAVILTFIIPAVVKLHKYINFWFVSLFLINIGYFWAQFGPFVGSVFGVKNPYPIWIRTIRKSLNFEQGVVFSLLVVSGYILSLIISLLVLRESLNNQKLKKA